MVRVIVVDGQAWSLPLLREKGRVTQGDLVLTWQAGQNSALDTRAISQGRDVGNVVVRRTQGGQGGGQGGGKAKDVVYDVTFAFVFNAFFPGREIHHN